MNTRGHKIFWKSSTLFILCGLVSYGQAAPRPKRAVSQAAAEPAPAASPTAPPKPIPPRKEALEPKESLASDASIGCDADPDCAEAVQRAISQSDSHQYEAALRTYEAVYQRWPTPWLLINLGRVQQKLNQPAQAIATYQRYLNGAPHDVSQRITVARAFLKQAEQEVQLKRYRQMLVEANSQQKPIHKKWWFWTALGGAAVAATAVGSGVGTQTIGDRTRSINTVNFPLYLGSF